MEHTAGIGKTKFRTILNHCSIPEKNEIHTMVHKIQFQEGGILHQYGWLNIPRSLYEQWF